MRRRILQFSFEILYTVVSWLMVKKVRLAFNSLLRSSTAFGMMIYELASTRRLLQFSFEILSPDFADDVVIEKNPSILFWDPPASYGYNTFSAKWITILQFSFEILLRLRDWLQNAKPGDLQFSFEILKCTNGVVMGINEFSLQFSFEILSYALIHIPGAVTITVYGLQFSFEILRGESFPFDTWPGSWTFNSLLRSSGSSGFIWVFKFCCLF